MTYILILFSIYFVVIIFWIDRALFRYEHLFGIFLKELLNENMSVYVKDIMDSTQIQAQVYFNLQQVLMNKTLLPFIDLL